MAGKHRVTPGAFGPTCQRHQGIVLDKAFFEDYAVDPARTYHNLLVDWLNGRPTFGLDARPVSAARQLQGCY